MNRILPRSFYQRDTIQVAKELLGKVLIRKIDKNFILSGIISETEGYKSNDEACHAYAGKTVRNKSLFGEVGHAYVYLSYGIHYCLNIVAHDKNECEAGGVLIRAVIPQTGIDYMLEQRKSSIKDLTNGPGKVAQAFSIDKSFDGIDATKHDSPIILTEGITLAESEIEKTIRIGISKNKDVLWRFLLKS